VTLLWVDLDSSLKMISRVGNTLCHYQLYY